MRRLQVIFNTIMGWFGHGKSRPEDIPKKLDAETLEKAMREARFLHSQHAVDVTSPAKDEIPVPRRVDKVDPV